MMERLARKHFERGRQFELQEQHEEAIEFYEKAVALEPESADAYLALGRLQAMRGQFQTALKLLTDASTRSNDPQIREWRAYVYGRLRRYEEALDDYRAVLDEGDPSVRVNLGRMLLALSRYDEAEAVLTESAEDAGRQLLAALPRYREFRGERLDDMRTTRYLFGRTLLLGTMGDGGLRPTGHRYLMLTARHVALTLRRLALLVDDRGWRFAGVAGDGPHHAPVARVMADSLGVPVVTPTTASGPVLICSAVVKGSAETRRIEAPWRAAKQPFLHAAVGLIPEGDPDEREPAVVGFAGRCAVYWHRVEGFSRLVQDREAEDGPWPGFKVGPAFVDPNTDRVVSAVLEAMGQPNPDPAAEAILAWYTRHGRTRAFAWDPTAPIPTREPSE